MLLKTLLFALMFIVQTILFAQSNTVCSGADVSGSGGTVSYTIGQIDYTQQQGSSGKISEGVQQPIEIYQTSGLENYENISVSIGPNPTHENIIIRCNSSLIEDVESQLFDNNGKLLCNIDITDVQTTIDMTSLAMGAYTLQISVSGKPVSSFRIVKN